MGKGFGRDFFKELSNTVFDTEWMSGLYGSKRNEQKKVLKQLFTQISDNNVTKEEKDVLVAKTETVQDRVERLEAKMAVLEEALAQNQAEINKQSKAIVNLVAQAEKESDELEKSQENLVERATRDVFYYLQRGEIGPDAVVSEIRKRIEGDSAFSMLDNKLLKTLDKLDSKKS